MEAASSIPFLFGNSADWVRMRGVTSADLVFATGNRAKLGQLAFVIAWLRAPFRLVSARERYGDRAAYEEVGGRAATIAARGAQEVAGRLGIPVVVEDTTFHVEALGGGPGVHAAEYLKEHGCAGILKALGEAQDRTAWIVSAVAWATPEGDVQVWTNTLVGHIAHRVWAVQGMPEWVGPSLEHPLGGGYNAIFIPLGEARTLAEIPPQEAISSGYREPNFCALLAFLRARPIRRRLTTTPSARLG